MFKKKEKGKKSWDLRDYQSDEITQRVNCLKQVVDNFFDETTEIRDDMDRYMKEFRGEWWNDKELNDNDSEVFANFLFSTVMTIAPLLTDNRPIWSIIARQANKQKLADLYSLGLEYLWDKLDVSDKMLTAIINALVMKVGLFKIYFCPTEDVIGELKIDIIDPRTFFIAPGYHELWETPFCGERKSRSLYWIRERYPEKGFLVQPEEDPEADYREKEDYECHNVNSTVYEIWMRDSEVEEIIKEVEGVETDEPQEKEYKKKYPYGKILVFAGGVLLEEKPYVYKHNKPPYVAFYDYKMPGHFFGYGEAEQIEELNKSINTTLQQMDTHVSEFCNLNWLLDSRCGLDADKIKEDIKGGGNVWTYNNTLTDGVPLVAITPPPIPRGISEYLSTLPKIVEEITGVTDISKGMTTKAARQSATEISTLIESSYTRTRQRVRNLESSVKKLCYLMVQIMQQFYTETRSLPRQKDGYVEWFNLSNKKNTIESMRPQMPEGIEKPEEDLDMENPEHKQFAEDMGDYRSLMEEYGDVDEVYFDFDIQVQTNSTLPMDKQSLANLFLKLKELQVVDSQAVLEQLRVPKAEEIVSRMKKKSDKVLSAKAGGQAPAMSGPASPMNKLKGGK